jgi:hypothetical protein
LERKEQLKKLEEIREKMDDTAKQHNVFPFEATVESTSDSLQELDGRMNQIENRTADTEWNQVPLIGSTASNSSRLKYVQSEIYQYLKQSDSSDNEKKHVSAWDVTHEYRDAIDVGSVKGIERIKHVFGINS